MTLSGSITAAPSDHRHHETEERGWIGAHAQTCDTREAPHLKSNALNVDLHIEQPFECAATGDLLNTKELHFHRHVGHVVVAHRSQVLPHAAVRQVGQGRTTDQRRRCLTKSGPRRASATATRHR